MNKDSHLKHRARQMFDLSCCASWPIKTKNFLLKKCLFQNSHPSTSSNQSSLYSAECFSEKVSREILRTSLGSVRTIRLSDNSFVHDFSDFSDPEKKISHARKLAHSHSDEEISQRPVFVVSIRLMVDMKIV